MISVLSTKVLNPTMRSVLKNKEVQLTEYDAIETFEVAFEVPPGYDNYIFTSKNSVRAFLKKDISFENCFCVGEKTKALLEKSGQKVVKKAANAQELADFIVKNHKNESFLFFCGNLRRDELTAELGRAKVKMEEVQVYKTELTPKAFQQSFDAILFYSPSGVESYLRENTLKDSVALCIGKTTARALSGYAQKTVVASEQTVEALLALLNDPLLLKPQETNKKT